jgi:oxygen-independent coproporphyrinogen-3 oxidase
LNRWQNLPDTAEYTRRMHAHEAVVGFTETLPAHTRRGEVIAFAMRTQRGVERDELAGWPEEVREFQELGFLREDAGRFVLTRRGKLMADSVARAFL